MKTSIAYGFGFGAATCLWTLLEYAFGFHTTHIAAGNVSSYLALALPLAFIVLAERAARARQPTISTARLIGVAIVVMLVGYLLTTPFLWVYHHYINAQWLDHLIAFHRDKLLREGRSAAEIERELAQLARGNSTSAQIVGGLVGSVVVGLVFGVPTALLLRRRSVATASAASTIAQRTGS